MQHGGKRITGNVIGKLGLLLAGLVVAEASLQVLVYLAPMKFRTALTEATSYDFRDENIGWQRRFLARYGKLDQQSIPMSQNEYVTHPVLGWMPKPNLSITNSIGQTYTTNSRGFRSPHEFERSADKYTVLVVGDSFTYGSWADDTEVWPTLLEGLDPEINLLNFGVAGFGVDQMSLMLEMQIEEFAPDLVVAAFISDDLHRTTLCFRDYWKPMYVIQNNDLVLRQSGEKTIECKVVSRVFLPGLKVVYQLVTLVTNRPLWIKIVGRVRVVLGKQVASPGRALSPQQWRE